MKQTPEMNEIQQRMQPGVLTLDGFLGHDHRNLIDILVEDDARVSRRDVTHEQIAAAMRSLMDAGAEGLGEFVSVPPHFEVRVESVRGKLPCPFGDRGLHRKTNVSVRNTESGEEVAFSALLIHLIGEHGFYEGLGSPYRVDPENLIRILEVAPEE
jgi:hypothetical protein